MGMAASQVRLMQLTRRKNDIGLELQHISLQKQSLTREMDKVSTKYQQALNTKVLKWSNNSGVDYMEITYAGLMTQSSLAQNEPQMLTNKNGKIVIDSRYQKYAEMISPDGTSGGTWDDTLKNRVIRELTNAEIIPELMIEENLSTAEKRVIDFYDKLFSSIAEKGWVFDNQVNDTNYLNNSLQNGTFRITRVSRDVDDETSTSYKKVYKNTYDTDIASNCANIFQVNDAEARRDAQVAYEHDKQIINYKESRLDARSNDLQTEQSAIQNMIKGLETVRNDNSEKAFNTFA